MTVPGTEVPELLVSVKLIVLACTGWLKVAVTVGTVAHTCDALRPGLSADHSGRRGGEQALDLAAG